VVTNVVLYLAFRRLQTGGLFLYENQHYFKIVSVCSLVLSVVLVDSFARSWRARRACLVAFIVMCGLLPWRVGFVADPTASYTIQGQRVFLPHVDGRLGHVVLIRGQRHDPAFENDGLVLKINGQVMRTRFDYADVFSADGLAIEPLRDMPSGAAEIDVPASMTLTSSGPAVEAGRLKIYFHI
jgi:hypothetical protein